jgi:hypothetical protein
LIVMANQVYQHGGYRPGAGARPKRSRVPLYPTALAAECAIAQRLPELIGKLFELAASGDRGALEYLVDRVLGRPIRRDEYVSELAELSDAELAERLRCAEGGMALPGDRGQ